MLQAMQGASHVDAKKKMKLYWPIVFAIVAIVAALLGFVDDNAPSAPAARVLSIIFLAFAALLLLTRMKRAPGTGSRPVDKVHRQDRRESRIFRDML